MGENCNKKYESNTFVTRCSDIHITHMQELKKSIHNYSVVAKKKKIFNPKLRGGSKTDNLQIWDYYAFIYIERVFKFLIYVMVAINLPIQYSF